VAVIGADIADTLFPGAEPLTQAVRIRGRRFTVIGVQARQGSAGAGSLDKYVWIPLRAYERAFGAPRTLQVFAKAAPGRLPVSAEDRARTSLRAKRALRPGVADTFDLLTPDAARGFVANLSQRIGAAAGAKKNPLRGTQKSDVDGFGKREDRTVPTCLFLPQTCDRVEQFR
jgi:putative ABC transport system permease protein